MGQHKVYKFQTEKWDSKLSVAIARGIRAAKELALFSFGMVLIIGLCLSIYTSFLWIFQYYLTEVNNLVYFLFLASGFLKFVILQFS